VSLYSRFYENIAVPFHNLVRRRQYFRHRRFLEKSQWWSRDELLDFQWKEVQSLLRHAFESVPYYQRKYREAGIRLADIRTREDFRRLPTLSRAEINAHREELKSTTYRGTLEPYATGGSSGQPTRFYRTVETYDWRFAASHRAYSWSGSCPGEPTVWLWGAPIGSTPWVATIKRKVSEKLQRQLILSTFCQTRSGWTQVYEQVRRFRPKFLLGYVSSLEEFCRFLAEEHKTVPGLRGVIGAAEPIFESTRKLVQEVLQAPLFNTYGSREFMSIAGECERHEGLHINCENLVVETMLEPEEGPSEVIVTDLHNYGMPFIRYRIGDLGVLDPTPCLCGRGLPRIKSVEGRVLDALRMENGRVVPGEFFPHLLKDIPEVREYQVRQESRTEIVLSAVLSDDLSIRSEHLLASEIEKVFGAGTHVRLNRVNEIPRLSSGKRRITIGLEN